MSNANISKIIVVGNLGRAPELRRTAKGNSVATLSLATSRGRKNAEGESEQTTIWHRAVVWGKQAESCAKFLTTGASVYVEGDLVIKDWVDKEGKARKTQEIKVENIRFLTFGNKRSPAASAAAESGEVSALTH